ncbi:MAG: peptide MFS transporter [Mediterranea massiliensis]|nr:peptide MFS transporter [Mediterranea massiliensis]
MFEGQPKGLYALALANTGERFGYYTMLAIFTLFLQAKFGYTEAETSTIFSTFLAGVYFLPLLGGVLADKFGYGKMVTAGFAVMFFGYLLLAVPSDAENGKWMMFGSLALIALGTGLFKGNLQVMVGNLYDDVRYSAKRDTAFSLFYMAINIGAMFAPTAAKYMTNWMLAKYDLTYNSQIPALAHQFLNGEITPANEAVLAKLQEGQGFVGSMGEFCTAYIEHLSEAYNYGFGVACISLIVSVLIYFGFRKSFKHVESSAKKVQNAQVAAQEELTPEQTKQRVVALVLVFAVVLFFWMAFHQNGLTMTFFARDYTDLDVTGLTRIGFNVWNLALLAIFVYAAFAVVQSKNKVVPAFVAVAALVGVVFSYGSADEVLVALPSDFQQFNPFFVVALTPFSLAIFGALAKKGKEPSAPRKIALGMLVAACGFLVLSVGSLGLPTPDALKADASLQTLVSPNWLISTYLVLTFAELLLSPMGISFVSKVAPPKLKGLMMGGWFAATAIGNYMVAIIGYLWGGLPLWMLWGILIVLCLLSALFMFSMMKRLEKVAK